MSRQAKLQEDTSFRVMRILEENPDLTQRELAEQLGMSIGGLNYCMKALIEKGYVKIENFHNSKNKFKYVYVLTPSGISQKIALTGRFLQRKLIEYESLKNEIATLHGEISGGATAKSITTLSSLDTNKESL
jgi:EPS-associated MarR family transcriptional regulator